MDDIDRKLLALLQKNAKLTMKELSSELGLSITPVYERLKRLERNKTILGYEARVDEGQAGFALEVYCCVTLESHKSDFLSSFKTEIQKFDDVMECYHLTGSFDFLLKVLVKDMDAYAAFVNNRLSRLQNVGLVQSMMVLDQVKRKSILPAF